MAAEQATPAEDEYLQTIYWLEEAGLPITGANVARALQVAPPTVHEMVGRLEADGYITRDEDRAHLPARSPDRGGGARARRAACGRRGGRQRAHPPLRERGRGPPALPQGGRAGAGPQGDRRRLGRRRGGDRRGRRAARGHPQRGGD